MCQRQIGEGLLTGPDSYRPCTGLGRRDQIAVAEGHAPGVTAGIGGEEERGDLGGIESGEAVGQTSGVFLQPGFPSLADGAVSENLAVFFLTPMEGDNGVQAGEGGFSDLPSNSSP